jgi:hypothetical protein
VTLLRHRLNEDRLSSERMMVITCDSDKPKFRSIASNGVRSSHAISIKREVSSLEREIRVLAVISQV